MDEYLGEKCDGMGWWDGIATFCEETKHKIVKLLGRSTSGEQIIFQRDGAAGNFISQILREEQIVQQKVKRFC